MTFKVLRVLKKLESREISCNDSFRLLMDILCPKDTPFEQVKVGDFLVFDKVYSESKRYTQGKLYKVNQVSINKRIVDDDFFLGQIVFYVPEFSITDDNGKERWIKKSGLPNYKARLIVSNPIGR